jgi:hypothetical protein
LRNLADKQVISIIRIATVHSLVCNNDTWRFAANIAKFDILSPKDRLAEDLSKRLSIALRLDKGSRMRL